MATPTHCNPLSIDFEARHEVEPAAGSVQSYFWDFGDGADANGIWVNHTYAAAGTYLVELTVTFADETSSVETLNLDVVGEAVEDSSGGGGPEQPAGLAVVAHAGSDQIVHEGDVVFLTGSATVFNTTKVPAFLWRQVSGPQVELRTPNRASASFAAPDAEDSELILVFELGAVVGSASGDDRVRIAVKPSNNDGGEDEGDGSGDGDDKATDPSLPSDAEVLAWLRELPPLPKVHYSYPIPYDKYFEPVDPLLIEYVRITRAFSISGEGAKEWQLQTVVNVCDQVNRGGEGTPVTVAINYSPWHRVFPPDLPPTYTGPEHAREIELFGERLSFIRDTLAAINAARRTNIGVSAILLDSERFYVKDSNDAGAGEWNAAIDAKYAAIYDVAREVYPTARVEWYGRGIHESSHATGWSPYPWFTFSEPGEALAASLYRLSEITTMRETFRRTHELALTMGLAQVTPWIALGAGYRRDAADFQVWQVDWDFDPVYSLLLGREINQWWYGRQPDRFAPWDAAAIAVFYPPPFHGGTPAWSKHFVAYVRGAAGRNDVP